MNSKQEIRREKLQQRKQLTSAQVEAFSDHIGKKVLQCEAYQAATTLLAYIETNQEVVTRAIIEDAWSKGKKVYLPKVQGEHMEFFLFESFEELKQGAFGIYEPTLNEVFDKEERPVVLVPGVAFGVNGGRIGYGKGYYDRYFETVATKKKIGLSFACQMTTEEPFQEYDIKMDIIVTENNCYGE